MPQCICCLHYKHGSAFYTYRLACGSLRFKSKCKDCSLALGRTNRRKRSRLSDTQIIGETATNVTLNDFKGVARRQLAYSLKHHHAESLSARYKVPLATIYEWECRLSHDDTAMDSD